MFAFIRGKLVHCSPTHAIIDHQGMGYKLSVPHTMAQKIAAVGETVQLFTSFVVRENSQTLYGFLTDVERETFEKLIEVSGIGPKIAQGILGTLCPQDLYQIVQSEDPKLLSKVPGIGKKTAAKLLLELKDKLSSLDLLVSTPETANTAPRITQDAVNALINLGYAFNVAQEAVKQAMSEHDKDVALPTLITSALQHTQ